TCSFYGRGIVKEEYYSEAQTDCVNMDQTGRCTTVITKASNCSYIYHNIEALCVAHSFATLSKDFFVVLHDMLKGRPEVSELYCVKSAKVPLMRFKVDGISIDVSYACLKPTLVMLQEGMFLKQLENMKMRSFMSILLPSCPYEFCHSNITKSTFYHIRAEIVRGYNMTRDILKPDFTWDNIFELFPYSIKYSKFAKIYLYNTNQCLLGDWLVGSSPASAVFSSFLREPGGIILDPPIHLLMPLLPSPPLFLPIDCSVGVLVPLPATFPFQPFQWITKDLSLFFSLWLMKDLFLLCKRKREERMLFRSSNRLCQYGSS
ncbi:hypothetical protein S245_043181, partial [Arachis hypogaea]